MEDTGMDYTISIHVPAWGTTNVSNSSSFVVVISIHVPAWGTTLVDEYLNMIGDISIHVPAWGTTSVVGFDQERYDNFNPRSRVGNDSEKKKRQHFIPISIHVPAWGTTKVTRNSP